MGCDTWKAGTPPAGFPQFAKSFSTAPRGLAEFYRQLPAFDYRPGDEPPAPGDPDPAARAWLVVHGDGGTARVAFQDDRTAPTLHPPTLTHRRVARNGTEPRWVVD